MGAEALEESFAELDDILAQAEEQAPSDVTGDVADVRGFFGGLNDAAAAVGYDDTLIDDSVVEELNQTFGEGLDSLQTVFAECGLEDF